MYKNSLDQVMMKAYKNGKEINKIMGERAKEYIYVNNNWEKVKKKVYSLFED